MIDAFIDSLQAFPRGLVFVAEALIILALAKFAKDAVNRHYQVNEEITAKGNLAVALRLIGYFLAIILIFLGVLYQPLTCRILNGWVRVRPELRGRSVAGVLYSLGGIVALNLVRVLFDGWYFINSSWKRK